MDEPRRRGRPPKSASSPDVARVEQMAPPISAERVMGARRALEYPALAAQNADEPNTDLTGRPEPQVGNVTIEARTPDDLHLGDGRILWGRGNGMFGDTDSSTGEAYEHPKRAKVTAELANALVEAGLAARV